MRRAGIYLVAICVLLPMLPVVAQEEPGAVVRVVAWKVQAGMENDFEAGLERHNDFHGQQNDAQAHFTYQIISGENTGTYLRIAPGRHWADFDAEGEWAEADEADSATNVDPYIESAEPRYYVYLPEMSRPAEGGPSAMAQVFFLHLNFGRSREFNYLMKKVAEGAEKVNWPVRYEFYALVNGGEHPTYVFVGPGEKWADFEEPEVDFFTMLEKAFGRDEAELVLDKLGKAIHCERSEIVVLRSDLSYIPAGE